MTPDLPRPAASPSLRRLRAVWVVASLFSLAILVFGPPARYAELTTICTGGPCLEDRDWLTAAGVANLHAMGMSLPAYAALQTGMEVAGQVGCLLLSALLAWRGRQDRTAATFAVLLAFQANLAVPEIAPPGWRQPLFTLNGLAQAVSVMAFLFLFPTGTFVPRWAGAYLAGWLLFNAVFRYWLRPPDDLWIVLDNAQWFVTILLAMGAQVYRYFRRSTPRQRLQTRWLLTVFFGVILATLLLEAAGAAPGTPLFVLNTTVSDLINPLLFVVIILAIRRHQLWDIDLILRRTLIYSVLSLLLAGVYFGSVLVLQTILRPLTGQDESALVTVLSTLALAALFVPLRGRVQAFIDRRFYRRKYDAAQVAAAFAGRMRDEVELERLTQQLLETVETTLQPAHASLWLRNSSH